MGTKILEGDQMINNMIAEATMSNTLVQDVLIKLLVKKKLISEKDIKKAIEERKCTIKKSLKLWTKKHKQKVVKIKPVRPDYIG